MSTIESVKSNGITVSYEIIIVDGGSTDGSLEWLLKQKDVITIIQHNRGVFKGKEIERRSWGYFMNLGFKSAQGKFLLMLSDDCLVTPNSIMNGIVHFEDLLKSGKNIAAAAFYWRNWPDQNDYSVGVTFGKMFVNHGLYLTSALESVYWINEDDYSFYHADGDLCLKLWKAGFEVVDTPNSYVEHFTHANLTVRESNLVKQKRDWETYNNKWLGVRLAGKKYDGDTLTKKFTDSARTVRNFPASERMKVTLNAHRSRVSKLIKKILS